MLKLFKTRTYTLAEQTVIRQRWLISYCVAIALICGNWLWQFAQNPRQFCSYKSVVKIGDAAPVVTYPLLPWSWLLLKTLGLMICLGLVWYGIYWAVYQKRWVWPLLIVMAGNLYFGGKLLFLMGLTLCYIVPNLIGLADYQVWLAILQALATFGLLLWFSGYIIYTSWQLFLLNRSRPNAVD
ncbi:MAG TPA: hypothetical protein VJJ83_02430 [Candidatus Babeliales bacterium]|nr:hypothetical protein [Candidatus Babeliales bacterium]